MKIAPRGSRLLLCVLVICLLQPIGGWFADAQTGYSKYSTTFFDTFDTVMSIIAYAPDEATFQRTTDQAHALLQRLHKLYDAYNAYDGINNLYTLNHQAAKGPVQVAPELMDLLMLCQQRQPITEDTVNIALGTVLQIWHDYREAGIANPDSAKLPPMEALQSAAQHTNMDDLILDPVQRTVRYADPLLQLDLGSVAKGYAVELVAQQMLASATPSFLINGGGNVRAGNPPLDGKRDAWGVGIQNPLGINQSDATSDIVETFFVSNLSLVTSGDYQRYYLVGGKRYHHLIDPATLLPGTSCRSATILCQDSGLADLLSTAAFLLPYAQSRALIESLEGVEALWVLADGTVQMTDGAKAFAKSAGATAQKK